MANVDTAVPSGLGRPNRNRRGGRGGSNELGPSRTTPVLSGDTLSADQIRSNQNPSSSRRTDNVRRGESRRGGGRGGSTNRNYSSYKRDASIDSISPLASQERSTNRRRAGYQKDAQQSLLSGQRPFGGRLTEATPDPTTDRCSLAGDATEFVPGTQHIAVSRSFNSIGTQQSQIPEHSKVPKTRRASKSQAPDIATRTHEDIANGHYECVICTNEVLPNSKVWNCSTCWSVLHLSCVKRWCKNEVSTQRQQAGHELGQDHARLWRCPGCNLPKQDVPTNYTCWCEKEVDPKSVVGIPPHSCGQSCSKSRIGRCPHPCDLICHAGPCPPCSHMGPPMDCHCGKETSSRQCVNTNYGSGWSCGQTCGDLLACGEHNCDKPCHEGVCGSCEVSITARCFCGQASKTLFCWEKEEEQKSELNEKIWYGSFDCGRECKREYDCGVHRCQQSCHAQDAIPPHCPLSIDMVTHCPCGKAHLDSILPESRKTCSDPIGHCQNQCQKQLLCGHLCRQVCHDGSCWPCLETIDVNCRCGRTTSRSLCHQGMEESPLCARICRSTLNCGRHECGERCCPGEKKASERQASKRKNRLNAGSRADDENIEAEHICLKTCGRPLRCGNHFCAELCHKGPCHSCLEAIFSEIACNCSRTILQPPQPCGTTPPDCPFDCTRERRCGHPQVKHQCHQDVDECPKCPFLVDRLCLCGKKTLKNQPCWFTDSRCGLPCGNRLKCGIHTCQSSCHRPGSCESLPCSQSCGRKKTVCEHSCPDTCHAPYPCKEDKPCQAKTFITCACQNQKLSVKCLASKSTTGNTFKFLECNDECLKLQRNMRLAAALQIDPSTYTDNHIPYSSATISFFQDNLKFGQKYEREFRVFAADEVEKRLRFKPMNANQRAFIHGLAEDFGFDSESQDPEPHRHVSIFKTPRFVSPPLKTLSQCVQINSVTKASEPALPSKPRPAAEPWNSFFLNNVRFGLTIDELRADIDPEFAHTKLENDVQFLPSGDCIIRVRTPQSWLQKIEPTLLSMKSAISQKVSGQALASSVSLCAVDTNFKVLRKEDSASAVGGGWSQVVKGGSAVKKVMETPATKKNSFTVLGLGRGKQPAGEVTDDWEKEVEAWDEA